MKNLYIIIALLCSMISSAQTTENILQNGNFHECNVDWILGGNYQFSYDCTGFYTQHNFSYGYAYTIPENHAYDSLYQYVAFPDQVTDIELELYHKISTEEIDNNSVYDELIIELISSTTTYEVDILSNQDYSDNYIYKAYSIPSNLFNNETVELRFTFDTDGLKPTRFRVDDISLFVTTTNGGGNNQADLTVLNIQVDDTIVEIGDEINASCTIKNIGDDSCDGTRTYYVISSDQFYSPDDIVLNDESTNSLDPNEIDNENRDITIPNVPTGVYYILIIADAEEEVLESYEDNNVAFIPISVINPTQELGSLEVNINPTGAVNDGAQWRLATVGVWQNSGAQLELIPNTYEIEFKEIPNWVTPANQFVSIQENQTTSTSGFYQEENTTSYGAITGLVYPEGARNNGAQFKIGANGNWFNHDTQITLEVGQYTVYFKDVPNYITPNPDTVIVQENVNFDVIGNYVEENNTTYGNIKGLLYPSEVRNEGAAWKIGQDGAWNEHNDEVTVITGAYSIYFKSVDGYATPAPQTINVFENQTTTVIGEYEESTEFGWVTVTLTPNQANNSGAKWRLDGGAWNYSGVTLADIPYGNHTIEFKDVTGFETPDSINFELDEPSEFFIGEYEEILSQSSINIIYPRGSGIYNGIPQYYDDAYVAGVKIRILAGLEYVPTNSTIELWYSLDDGNSWDFAQVYQGGFSNGTSVLDVEWYCNDTIDSQDVKVKLVTVNNGQNIEAVNNGVFEIHPANKFIQDGFSDSGLNILEDPFHLGDDLYLDFGNTNNDGGHICFDYYSFDYGIFDTNILGEPINVTCGKPFYSPIEGKVININNDIDPNCIGNTGSNSGIGNQVLIQSSIDKTKAFRILHLNYVNVSEGDYINVGEYIGDIGSTGANTTGAHAHITLYKNISVSSDFSTNDDALRFFDFLAIDNIDYSLNNCGVLKNYHAAPLTFLEGSSSSLISSSINTIVISDLETSKYTLDIPLDNISPNIAVYSTGGTQVWNQEKAIMVEENGHSTKTIDLSDSPSGVYFLLIDLEGKIETLKIIKS